MHHTFVFSTQLIKQPVISYMGEPFVKCFLPFIPLSLYMFATLHQFKPSLKTVTIYVGAFLYFVTIM